ncbi:MAG: hypothetical protein Q4Q62_04925 [Thermoplasmata archaeon]|nr:hypothetical protein [Thermoplasmata archaeon]
MSTANGPMTFDELSELYRVEMKSASLTAVRKDLFRALANLLTALRQELDRQVSVDPDSVMAEGADQRRKKAERLCKDVVILRTRKIASMAIRGAEGARNSIDCMTDEERAYYDTLLALTERQFSEVDRLRGRKVTIATRIDEPPARDAPAPVREPEAVQEPEPVPEPVHEAPAAPAPEPAPVVEEPAPAQEIPADDAFVPEDMADEPFPDDDIAVPEEAFDEPFDEPDTVPDVPAAPAAPTPAPEPAPEARDDGSATLLIRILEDLPAFAGPDRDYNLSKEDLVTLPRAMAEILVNSEKAAAIRPTP